MTAEAVVATTNWLGAAAKKARCMVGAVVSLGDRPDLAGQYLDKVRAPTLLMVDENDHRVIGMNQEASFERLKIMTRGLT